MAQREVEFRVKITNKKALRALGFAVGVLADLEEDLPWRPEIQKATQALLYAARHLTPEVVEQNER